MFQTIHFTELTVYKMTVLIMPEIKAVRIQHRGRISVSNLDGFRFESRLALDFLFVSFNLLSGVTLIGSCTESQRSTTLYKIL